MEKGRFSGEEEVWWRKGGLVDKGRIGREREVWWKKGGL